MDYPQQFNRLDAVGTLKSKDIEFVKMTFKNAQQAREVVRGNVVVQWEDKGKINEQRIDVFSTRYSANGEKELPSYKSAKRLNKMKALDDLAEDEKERASRLIINGNVDLNSYTDSQGDFHKNTRLSGSFFREIDKEDERKDGVHARLALTVLGYEDETNRDQEPTGNKYVKVVNVGYNNRLTEIPYLKFDMSLFDEDVIEQVADIYDEGATGYFEIEFKNYVESKKTEAQKQGFGRKLPQVINRYIRSTEIVFIEAEPYEEENKEALSDKQVAAAKRSLANIGKEEKSTPSKPAAKKSGFGKASKSSDFNDIEISDDEVPF